MGAPWSLWGAFWSVLGSLGVLFGRIFLVQGDVLSGNSENLDFDDPLNEIARFLRSQGLRNEVQIDPKTIKREERREKGRESREESGF